MKTRRYDKPKRKSAGYKREGYVYILSNPAMPELIKVGYTTRDIDRRIFELSSATGVPEHFKLEYKYFSKSPKDLEQKIHQCLNSHRASRYREFFKCSPSEAVRIIREKINITPENDTTKEPQVTIYNPDHYKEKFYSSLYSDSQKTDMPATTPQKEPSFETENWVINCNHCNYNNLQKLRPKLNEEFYCEKCGKVIF